MLDQFLFTLETHNKKYALILGMLSGLAFAPLFFLPLLLAISILCFQIKRAESLKDSFILGLLFGFGHFLTSMYWISLGVTVYINEFWWAIPLALFGIPLILSFFVAAACVLSWFARNSQCYHFIFCISFILFEWLRSWMFTGLPWNLLAYSLGFSDTLVQIVSVIGVYGLGFLVVYVFSMFYHLLTKEYKELLVPFSVASIIIISLLVHGYVRLSNNPTGYTNIKVRLVQPSIRQSDKWDVNEFWRNMETHINLSLASHEIRSAVIPGSTRDLGKEIQKRVQNDDAGVQNDQTSDTDLIIWSEAALTAPYNHPQIKQKLMKELLSRSGAILITGGISDNNKADEDLEIYTTMQAINPVGKVLFEYHKSHLVPFGEYMPLKDILPFKKLTHGFLDYTPGEHEIVYLKKLNLKIKPLICYESIFPSEARTTNDVADVFVNITNDAWYGNSSGPYQHLVQSRMRSVENGIPMLRAANNGISAVIDSLGRTTKSLSLNEVGVIDSFIPNKLELPTIYSKYGELMAIACAILVLISQYLIYSHTKLDLHHPVE